MPKHWDLPFKFNHPAQGMNSQHVSFPYTFLLQGCEWAE